MPFYEYECSSCRYYAEVMQKITDTPLKKCPSCGQTTFKKLISAPVFRLKGSGWYETDFKTDQDSKRNLAGAEQEEAKPAAEVKPDEKAGEKPGEKPEAKTAAEPGAAGAEKPKADTAAAKADKTAAPGSEPAR